LPQSRPGDTRRSRDRDCGDEDCDHYPCKTHRTGYDEGFADGRAAGYGEGQVDGFIEGYNAGQAAAART
jgi:hypothetical protein